MTHPDDNFTPVPLHELPAWTLAVLGCVLLAVICAALYAVAGGAM